MKKLFISLLVLVSVVTGNAQEQRNMPNEPYFRGEFIFGPDTNYPSCHASTIVELPNGDLLAAWYAGTREKAKDVAVLGARLPKGSVQWAKPFVLADTPDHSEGNPVLFVDRSGTVWLFYMTMYTRFFFWRGWQTCKIKFMKSFDNGSTWTPPEIVLDEYGWMVRNKAITLDNGNIVLPMYDEREWSSAFMISEDTGRTWQRYGKLIVEGGPMIQPTVVQRSDGSLLALMRRGGDKYRFAWQSVSTDGGRTWSEPRQTQFKNSNAALDMVRLANGHLVVVLNDVFDNREVLHVAVSRDEGVTWEKEKVLEEKQGGEFSYPAVIQVRGGLIHITYTYNRKLIKHVVLNEVWIEQ